MLRRSVFSQSPAGRALKPLGVIGSERIASVSKWTWPFCRQFTTIVHDATLAIPTSNPLHPSAAVFAQLKINEKLLLNPPTDKYLNEHCKIEQVMKRMGFPVDHIKRQNLDILDHNTDMVEQLSGALLEEKRIERHERQIDYCAHSFLRLTGFAKDPFKIVARGGKFDIFGKKCYSNADHYVADTRSNDLVLVFEDKSLQKDAVLAKHGHLGQIVGELLQMMSLNRGKETFRSVFAVRFINYRVTAFRVCPSKATLDTLCDSRKVPTPPLQLLCSEAQPLVNHGLSLIDPVERMKALQLMADIRRFIVNGMKK